MVFIDTGGWISIAVASDRFHEVGVNDYFDLLTKSVPLFTSNYVLDETITRLQYDFGYHKALEFCDLYEQAERQNLITTLWVEASVVKDAFEIFRKYSDHRFSFTDCTSFALMKRHSLNQTFSFDSHFEILGFLRQPQIFLQK